MNFEKGRRAVGVIHHGCVTFRTSSEMTMCSRKTGQLCIVYVFIQTLFVPETNGHGGIISETGQVFISSEEQNNVLVRKRAECYRQILEQPTPNGTFCNRTFDNILCWPDTSPGKTSYLPCPDYIQSFYITGNASRTCLEDGTWLTSPITNLSWTNYTQCMQPGTTNQHIEVVSPFLTTHVAYIQVMCSTGYAFSFVSLVLAVVIMIRFRKLHCPRNTVHVNLFMSFILKAVLSFSKDIFWVQGVGFSFDVEQTDTKIIFRSDRTHWECKLFTSISNYAQTANYFWILIEGLYLHTLVYVSVFSERSSVRWYYLLGWGTPFLSVLPWVAIRVTFENLLCWNTNTNLQFVWILKSPIVLTLVINFAFFVNILRALFTKLHKPTSASARRNRYRRLAKATLILIPLFGVHYIVFLGVPDRIDPTAEIVKLYFEIFFNSFQGFLVAVLFCFLNQEVQMELRKAWYRWTSKPDPVYIQQSQYLADSNGNRRVRKCSNPNNPQPYAKQYSSEHSSDIICLCKWTLDKNGKIRREFIAPVETRRKSKKKKEYCETKI